MTNKEKPLTDEELSPLAEILARQFVQRWDMYPKQLEDGTYVTMHEPLHVGLLYDHLWGKITMGTYLLDQENQGHFMVLDADNPPDWRRLQALAVALSEMGGASYLERSRRAGHLWMFFDERKSGREIRQFGQGLLDHFGIHDIELFPKQDQMTTGPGSLIRLPFGVHLKTSRRYGFYMPDGEPLAPTLREQIHILGAPKMLPEAFFERFREYGTKIAPERASLPIRRFQRDNLGVDEEALVSERIKAAIPVRQFVLGYVELSPSGRGHCPFHGDEHPSFGATDEYWTCFAGCGGGSIIDFYMMYQEKVMGRDCDFKLAVKELAELLL